MCIKCIMAQKYGDPGFKQKAGATLVKRCTADGFDWIIDAVAIGTRYVVYLDSITEGLSGRIDNPSQLIKRQVIWAEPYGYIPLELLELDKSSLT